MRRILTLVTLLAILAAPYVEYSHDHCFGQSHDDCPGCHVESNPALGVSVSSDTVALFTFEAGHQANQPTPFSISDPLRVAPKTSPPRARSC